MVHRAEAVVEGTPNDVVGEEGWLEVIVIKTLSFCGGDTKVVDGGGESSQVYDDGGIEKVREGEGTRVGHSSEGIAPLLGSISSEGIAALIGSISSFGVTSTVSACEWTADSFSSRRPEITKEKKQQYK